MICETVLAEQSRAEQSRAEQSRAEAVTLSLCHAQKLNTPHGYIAWSDALRPARPCSLGGCFLYRKFDAGDNRLFAFREVMNHEIADLWDLTAS
jgi:hypothetical protein